MLLCRLCSVQLNQGNLVRILRFHALLDIGTYGDKKSIVSPSFAGPSFLFLFNSQTELNHIWKNDYLDFHSLSLITKHPLSAWLQDHWSHRSKFPVSTHFLSSC